MNIDINAQKEAEQELRAARDELEQHVAERTAELEVRASQLVKLTAELTRAEQAERRRLAGVLHDHLQQLLAAAMINVEMIGQEGKSASGAAALSRASGLLTEALEASRSLMVELSPPILKESLCAALEWLCFVWMKEKHGLEVALTTDPQADSPNEDICTAVFLAVRELLFNIVKHANVGQASVSLTIDDDDFLHATVEDSGDGFDTDAVRGTAAGVRSGTGLGLFGLSERLSMIGGRLEIGSRMGDGTRITVVVPRVI
jgi:signal transduction histidine kinase